MRETMNEGLKPVLDAQMSKMSPEQRVAMASLNEEAKKREEEKRKWDNQVAAQKLKEKPMEEIEIAAITPLLPEDTPPLIKKGGPTSEPDLGIGAEVNQGPGEVGKGPRHTVPQVTNYLRYNQDTLAVEMERNFNEEIMALRSAGQKEYAHDVSSPFANFERGAKDMGIDRKQVLWIYAMKHKDGIAAAIKGHTSQREDVRGRINDLIVYLNLLRAMYNEEFGGSGSFGLGKLEK